MPTREEIVAERNRVRAEYAGLFDEVAAILFELDPIGINFETNTDEYEPEVETILPRLRTCQSLEDARKVIHEEFTRWFDRDTAGSESSYQVVAERIWAAWQRTRKECVIRLATSTDVDDIARLHVATWQVAYRGHMPDAHLDGLDPSKRAAMWSKAIEQPDTVVLVASAGEALVGFCSVLPSRDADAAPAVGEIAAIYVDPSVWRSGIGRSLVEAAIAAALPRNFSELTLWVLTGNAAARAFYESCGFSVDGHTKIEERRGFSIHETRYRRRIAA